MYTTAIRSFTSVVDQDFQKAGDTLIYKFQLSLYFPQKKEGRSSPRPIPRNPLLLPDTVPKSTIASNYIEILLIVIIIRKFLFDQYIKKFLIHTIETLHDRSACKANN